MNYRYGPPNDVDEGFAGIVERTNDLHTITRSTVPLLAWWRDNAEGLGPDLANATAYFEHAVRAGCRTCGGKGKASMTDVMVVSDSRAIAVEAKYTEPKYETVSKWRNKSNVSNRKQVLAHWLHLVAEHTGTTVDDESGLDKIVYQTVHRTASACAAARPSKVAEVLYLVFFEGERPNYFDDMKFAAGVLDPAAKIQFTVVEVRIERGDDFVAVQQQMANAADDDAADILAEALTERRDLYRFVETTRRSVR